MHGQVSLDDSTSIEESHRLIDEAIAQHQASISVLKSQKNGLAPISRLHPELLCLIFSLLKTKASFRYKDTSHLDWIVVTHVSSHWRHVALDSPTLWVDLPLDNPRWVQEMLQRSKNAGLVVEADLRLTPVRPITPGLELALQHSWRIKHLSIQGFDGSTWNDLQKAMPRSAPQLEYLCLTGDSKHPITSSAFTFSQEVFYDTGHLRHFKLSRCNLDWTSLPSLLRNLTHLTLVLHLTPNAKPTGNQFMEALTRMPDLQSLCMVHAVPVEQTWSFEPIHLASLRNLSIESTQIEVYTFFRYITFPPTAMVHVDSIMDKTSISYADIMSVLSRSYSIPFRNLVLLRTQPSDVFLKLFANDMADLDDPIYYYTSVANLEIIFAWMAKSHSRNQYLAKFVTDIFNSRVLLQNVCMHVDFTGRCDKNSIETIANTFGRFPLVRSIKWNSGILKFPST